VPGGNRPSSKESDDDGLLPALVRWLVRCDDEGGGMATVSPRDASGRGVSTDPQELQKRLDSGMASEQDGHLVMIRHHKPEHKCPICEQFGATDSGEGTTFQLFMMAICLP
jgi:hypothetical protein